MYLFIYCISTFYIFNEFIFYLKSLDTFHFYTYYYTILYVQIQQNKTHYEPIFIVVSKFFLFFFFTLSH